MRHLEDIDDLNYGLNAPLKPNQEENIRGLSRLVEQRMGEKGKKGVIIYCSPKERCIQTSELIREQVKRKFPKSQIYILKDPKIRELDQGKLNLPERYNPGDYFDPLQSAWNAFVEETFGKTKNIHYKFGEKRSDGLDSKLLEGFISPGESCAEFHSRIYSAIHQFGVRDTPSGYESILLTHSAIIAIMKELEFIAKDIKDGKSVNPENLIHLTWEKAQHLDKESYKKFGFIETLNANYLNNKDVLKLLKKGEDYLNIRK